MKKVLIPTMPWPPMGGVGVRRKAKMAKYLDRNGVEVHVVTAPNTSGAHTYDSDVASPTIRVTQLGSPLSMHNYMRREMQWIVSKALRRGVSMAAAPLFNVDYAQRWNRHIRRLVPRYLAEHDIAYVYSSGMPFSTVWEMARLKRELGDRMVLAAEWRDYWTEYPGRHYPWPAERSRRVNARMEHEVLDVADIVIAVTPMMRDVLASRMTRPERCVFLPNGFDLDDFAGALPVPSAGTIRLAHTGDVGPTRIEALTRVLDAVRILEQHGKSVEFSVMGAIGGQDGFIRRTYPDLLDSNVLALAGKRSPAEAGQLVAGVDYGVALVQRKHPEALPSKVFDYIGAGKTIIAVGPDAGDLRSFIEERGLGLYVAYDDPAGPQRIADYIRSGGSASPEGLAAAQEEFDCERIALRLLDLFERAERGDPL